MLLKERLLADAIWGAHQADRATVKMRAHAIGGGVEISGKFGFGDARIGEEHFVRMREAHARAHRRRRLLSMHTFRRLIAAQPQEHAVPNRAFARELREAHLRDERRLNPFRASRGFARDRQRGLDAFDLRELFMQRGEHLVIEASSDIAAIAQLAVFFICQH